MVQIYIPEATRDRLKKHAVEIGLTITELVVPTLTGLLERLDKAEKLEKKNGGKKTK